MTAFKSNRGIGIKPNFTFVEYLISRRGTPGIVVSFYGEPDQSTIRRGFCTQIADPTAALVLKIPHGFRTFSVSSEKRTSLNTENSP